MCLEVISEIGQISPLAHSTVPLRKEYYDMLFLIEVTQEVFLHFSLPGTKKVLWSLKDWSWSQTLGHPPWCWFHKQETSSCVMKMCTEILKEGLIGQSMWSQFGVLDNMDTTHGSLRSNVLSSELYSCCCLFFYSRFISSLWNGNICF